MLSKLCYSTVVDLLVSSHVGIPLQIIDYAAPLASCNYISWEWGLRINMQGACAMKPSPVVSHLISSGTAWQFWCQAELLA